MNIETSVRSSLILGISGVIAATVFGIFFSVSRTTESTVRVVGSSTRRVDSDVAKLRMSVNRFVGRDDVRRGYREAAGDVSWLQKELMRRGFDQHEIQVNPATASQTYSREGVVTGYMVQQWVAVISKNVDQLQELSLNPDQLMGGATGLQSFFIEFYSSQLADIKKELLADATADARKRAEEIVRGSGLTISGVSSARAGVFQITEPYSTEVTDYGVYNTSTREKDITVTVAVTFIVR